MKVMEDLEGKIWKEVTEVTWLVQLGEEKVRGALMAAYTFLMGTLTLLKERGEGPYHSFTCAQKCSEV